MSTIDAPILRPSKVQWADPFAYLRSIQSLVEQFGIARIIPPPDWRPPFALDGESLRLRATAQRISEHLATYDVRQACFLRDLKEFLSAVGQPLSKVPSIGGKDINLHRLYQVVVEMGGYHQVLRQFLAPVMLVFTAVHMIHDSCV